MPKKPTAEQVAEWRRLRLEGGLTYKDIAGRTGWQARTVRAHVEEELRTAQAAQIRVELFKERLGEHWDALVERVAAASEPAWAWEFGTATGRPGPRDHTLTERTTSGVRIRLEHEGAVVVHLLAREALEWPLLQEHLKRDPLWKAARSFESAIAQSLRSDRALYDLVEEELVSALNLEVLDQLEGQPGIGRKLVNFLFGEAVSGAHGTPARALRPEDIEERSSGQMTFWALTPGVIATDVSRENVARSINEVMSIVRRSDAAGDVGRSDGRVKQTTRALRTTLEHIRLLRYLPGTCQVCRRYEV